MYLICKYYAILHEGLEHPRILVPAGKGWGIWALEPIPCAYQRTTVHTSRTPQALISINREEAKMRAH